MELSEDRKVSFSPFPPGSQGGPKSDQKSTKWLQIGVLGASVFRRCVWKPPRADFGAIWAGFWSRFAMFFGSIFRRRRDREECEFDTVFAMFQPHRPDKKETKKEQKSASMWDPCARSVWKWVWRPFGSHFGSLLGAMLAPKSKKWVSGGRSKNRPKKNASPSHATRPGTARERPGRPGNGGGWPLKTIHIPCPRHGKLALHFVP